MKDAITGDLLPFPESVRVRRYDAEFADGAAQLTSTNGTGNRVPLGGVDQYAYPGMPLMTLNGTNLTIIVPPADGGGYIYGTPTCAGGDYWWEFLSNAPGDNEAFESCGTWRASIDDPDEIAGMISGSFGYYRGVGPHWRTDLFCRAGDHHFTLVKR